MTTITTSASSTASSTPAPFTRKLWMILIFAGLVFFTSLGLRHSFGLFLEPITREVGVNREVFGFALALQNLLWGLGQPIAGYIADRYGSARVIFVGGLLYAGGLMIAANSTGPAELHIGFGVMTGLGLSCTSFAVVMGAVGRSFPPERRSTALGIASACGSIGIFASVPGVLALISSLGWSGALMIMGGIALVMCMASTQLQGRASREGPTQSLREVLSEAFGHRGYMLLVLGFFVCGFQLALIGTHLPAFLLDRHLDVWMGGAALTTIGAANIVGTLAWGSMGDHYSKRKLLALLYTLRAASTVWFMMVPTTNTNTLIYCAMAGLMWLGTVPLTSGIVAQVFGPRYLTMLVGIVFVIHQVGSFLGAWLGGMVFEMTGSYDLIWWSMVPLSLLAALLHWPIDERPLSLVRSPQPA